jgi:hypothetical protein
MPVSASWREPMKVTASLTSLRMPAPVLPEGWSRQHMAEAEVEITYLARLARDPVTLHFSIEGYQDLSDAAEKVRKEVEDFARALLEAAAKPLIGAVLASEPATAGV